MINFFKKKRTKLFEVNGKPQFNSYISSYKINKNILNELCEKNGCDKGLFESHSDFFSWYPHNYTDIYDDLFFDRRIKLERVFELGIGTNKAPNQRLIRTSKPGASLRVWKEYFPNAVIYGGDIDKKTMFSENRIKTFLVDQTNEQSVKNMWGKIKINNFDIIIDDGLHTFEAAKVFFENSFIKLKKNGYYFIEDIFHKDIYTYLNYFLKKKIRLKLFSIRNKNYQVDNNLIMLRNLNRF